jgi:two-component system, chemotaxis family, protein-glutamate methylesterase/glutaminase
MESNVIRVLIVDDSAVLRQSTKFIVESDPELKVVGEAINGVDAVALVAKVQPDVITMDIRMPKMDGLEAIREIMAAHPVPIVVVTSIDLDREMGISAQATKLGAVSVLSRPTGIGSSEYKNYAENLVKQVKLMSTVKVIHRIKSTGGAAANQSAPTSASNSSAWPTCKTEIIAIGSSTGGPAALHKILSALPADVSVPIVIVQHISFGFVGGLASWLNDASKLAIKVGQAGEKIQPGTVYIAPDDRHMVVNHVGHLALSPAPAVGGHRPSVTPLFESVAESFGPAAIGVILTGMGADGAAGMKKLCDAGGMTIAQDQNSCVVYGMPKEAIALNAVRSVVPLDNIAQKIQELLAAPVPQ